MNSQPPQEQAVAAEGFQMRQLDFERVRDHLYELTGISLDDCKRDMVYARLTKRLRFHRLDSFHDYLDHLEKDSSGAERQEFINCLTTNKTDFFRESHHFDFLRESVLPGLESKGRQVRIWSAGCSTGEEPYTLAMTLRDACPASENWDLRILASDIDTRVLATAEQGIYDLERLGDTPPEFLKKYFLRGTGEKSSRVAARPELRELIRFRQINLMDDYWPIQTRFDAIFCRNVIIYFDNPTKKRLLEKFADYLKPEGYLILGHSENVQSLTTRYQLVGKTTYRSNSLVQTPAPLKTLKSVSIPPYGESVSETAQVPRKVHTIIIGDVKVSGEPAVLSTLLGSCVSACIYDPEAGVGGMNHFSLPGVSDEGVNSRYGAYAMEMLITAVMKQGGERTRLRAKVFGGAKVLNLDSERLNVGARNAEFVLEYLVAEGIPVEARCLGGTNGLLVRFCPDTGQARVKPLPNRELSTVLRDEQRFGQELLQQVKKPADDVITLF